MNNFKMSVGKQVHAIAWSLAVFVSVLSFSVWGSLLRWKFNAINDYALFPLFGLVAFSIMWTHYIVYALKVWANAEDADTKKYSKITGYIVLVSLLAHPVLFVYAQYRLGLGLPPSSYAAYVGEGAVKFVYLGTLSLLAFMAYELKRWLEGTIAWRSIVAINTVALLFVLIHGAQLGRHLSSGWFLVVWYMYGGSLLTAYAYLAYKRKLF